MQYTRSVHFHYITIAYNTSVHCIITQNRSRMRIFSYYAHCTLESFFNNIFHWKFSSRESIHIALTLRYFSDNAIHYLQAYFVYNFLCSWSSMYIICVQIIGPYGLYSNCSLHTNLVTDLLWFRSEPDIIEHRTIEESRHKLSY